jgi:hypothetical protein
VALAAASEGLAEAAAAVVAAGRAGKFRMLNAEC